MLTSVCVKIIDSMARTLHVMAYADAVEQGSIKGPRASAGQDWMDIAPKTRPEAKIEAAVLAGQIITMNKKGLLFLLRDAMYADAMQNNDIHLLNNLINNTEYDDKYIEDFGHCLAMQSLGSGVSWFDDHAEFSLELPHIEFYY